MDAFVKRTARTKRKRPKVPKIPKTSSEFIASLRASRSTAFAEQVATKEQRQRIKHVTSTVHADAMAYFSQERVDEINSAGGILFIFFGEQAPLHSDKITHWAHNVNTDVDYRGSILPAASKALGYTGTGVGLDKIKANAYLLSKRAIIVDCLPLSLNYTSALRASLTYAHMMAQVALRIRKFFDDTGMLVSSEVRVIWSYKKCGEIASNVFKKCRGLQLKATNGKEIVLNTEMDSSSLGATAAGYPHHATMRKALAQHRKMGVLVVD